MLSFSFKSYSVDFSNAGKSLFRVIIGLLAYSGVAFMKNKYNNKIRVKGPSNISYMCRSSEKHTNLILTLDKVQCVLEVYSA